MHNSYIQSVYGCLGQLGIDLPRGIAAVRRIRDIHENYNHARFTKLSSADWWLHHSDDESLLLLVRSTDRIYRRFAESLKKLQDFRAIKDIYFRGRCAALRLHEDKRGKNSSRCFRRRTIRAEFFGRSTNAAGAAAYYSKSLWVPTLLIKYTAARLVETGRDKDN